MADVLTIPSWLAADRVWLSKQPGMSPWTVSATRILERLRSWLKLYSVNLGVPDDSKDCEVRLWACWAHHWRTAIEKSGKPVDGIVVAEQIEAGRGYRRSGNLGGNVIRDVLLASAMLHKSDAAIRVFENEYRATIARQVIAARRFAQQHPSWWNDLLVELVGLRKEGDPGRLSRFAGQSGLVPWTVTVAVRMLSDRIPKKSPASLLDPSHPEPATEKTGAVQSAVSADCVELLTGRIRTALGQLRHRERLALRMLAVDGLQGQEIAAAFRINPGNVSRLLHSARESLWKLMAADESQVDQNRECFDALLEGGSDKNLADALRHALEELSPEGEP